MTNQDTHEPQAIARNGNVIVTGWDAEYTPEAALAFIGDLAIAYREALRQLAAIIEACAQGHTWNSGYNSPVGDKHTVYHCTREGCQGRNEEPGWLPFEPKQHIVPFSPTLRDCTGPGCEHCADEAFGDQMRCSLADIGAVEFVGETLGGPLSNGLTCVHCGDPIKRDTKSTSLTGWTHAGGWQGTRCETALTTASPSRIVAKKHAIAWSVDATPEQVQAALDARQVMTPEKLHVARDRLRDESSGAESLLAAIQGHGDFYEDDEPVEDVARAFEQRTES